MGWMKKASTAVTHLSFRQHPNPTSATSSPCCQTDDLKAQESQGETQWEVCPSEEKRTEGL